MLSVPLLLAAGAVAAPASACAKRIADYGTWREAPGQQWDFRDPALTVIGAEHARDPAHPQFERIRTEFEAAKPGVVFYEGPNRPIADSADETIRSAGESGYARFLARAAGLEFRSLEMPPGEQIRQLAAQFPADQVSLFFVLREAARLRDREGKMGEALDGAITGLLGKMAPITSAAGFSPAFGDIAGLEAAAARYWPGRDWRTIPSDWFSPLANDRKTGGVFTGAVNRADSNNRNRHMFGLLTAAASRGERPFVVVGRNHVPMLAPALACALRR